MADLPNPHDHFFRATFARREVAADFARHYLPPAVVAHLDLNTLESTKDSFVDDALRAHFTDLLYHVQLRDGTPAYVYLLFEHKSYSAPGVAFQLLRYMVRIWEHGMEQRPVTRLPAIVPLVVYHGPQRWQVDQRFSALVAAPAAFADYVPDFRYSLSDLSAYSDAELAGAVGLQVTLLLLKHIFDAEWHTTLPKIMALLEKLAQAEDSLAYIETVLRYMATAARSLGREELTAAVNQTFPETGGALMQTIAQTWVEEGAMQTRREDILALLDIRFGPVADRVVTVLAQIEDLDHLKNLHKQTVLVDSLAEFEMMLAHAKVNED
jgi:predicted transposase/invertase (TIGR01784 family)